jgi:putative endonuclease
MARHNDTGATGERLGAEYLTGKGYHILHRNWRHAQLEVDIIAEKETVLHFIEVKTRRSRKFGFPEDQVDRRKLEHLISAAEEYLILNPQWKRIQFDILSISQLKQEPVEYFLIEDVYL